MVAHSPHGGGSRRSLRIPGRAKGHEKGLDNTVAHTGRRASEVLGFEWSGARLDAEPPYWELPGTKNGTHQYVPLGERLMSTVYTPSNVERLKAGEDAREGLSKDWQTYPFPWVYNSVHGRFERLCSRLGIEHRRYGSAHVSLGVLSLSHRQYLSAELYLNATLMYKIWMMI